MARHSRKRSSFPRTVLTLLVLAVLAALYIRWGNRALESTQFTPVFARLPEGFDGCRIVVLGDLHSTLFGEENAALLEAVQRSRSIFF